MQEETKMSEALMKAAMMYNDPRFVSASEIRIYNNKKRRMRIVRRQRLALAAIIAVIVATTIFIIMTLTSNATSDTFVPEYKYYKQITVHSGDTLWNIASANMSEGHYRNLDAYIAEVSSINHLPEDGTINAGENLIIPYFSSEYK